MSSMPKPAVTISKRGDQLKSIYADTSVPSSFTISTYYGYIFGNFWVPAALPSGHHAHLAQYDVTSFYFASGTYQNHFVNSLLTASDNFDTWHSGKGVIFGPGIAGGGPICSSQSAVTETWSSRSYQMPKVNPIVWNAAQATNSCSPDFFYDNQTYRIFAGANDLQESTYWLYMNGSASPFFMAPTVNSYTSEFATGAAGVSFLVVSIQPTLPVSEYWRLEFKNVSSWTQP